MSVENLRGARRSRFKDIGISVLGAPMRVRAMRSVRVQVQVQEPSNPSNPSNLVGGAGRTVAMVAWRGVVLGLVLGPASVQAVAISMWLVSFRSR